MSISITCTGCDSVYPVGENLIGKTIRCKKCGEMMPVEAPAKPAARVEEDMERPPRRSRSSVRVDEDEADETPRRSSRRQPVEDDDDERPASRSRRRAEVEDDEEEDDRPRRSRRGAASEPKSKMPLIIGGVLAFLLIAGGVGAAVYFSGGDEDEPENQLALNNLQQQPIAQPKTPPTTEPGSNTSKPPTPAPKPNTPETSVPEKKNEPNEVITKTTPTPTPAIKTTPDNTVPMAPVFTGRGSTKTGGSLDMPDRLSPLNLDRVKRSSVFLKTETDTSISNGSGWLGLESNLIITNAHVLGMKVPNSPEPKKLTAYLNAGTPDQIEIPHSKLKILAVDRQMDLAIIRVSSMPNMPSPLKVRLSSTLRETETVYTVGFPLGSDFSTVVGQTRKEPSVSVRTTSVAGSQADDYGQIISMKLEGGVNPGNSGGAVVDTNGEVVAVVVAMFGGGAKGNYIGLAIPTEYVNGLAAGRVSKINYGIPYREGDKVKVPITADVLNPFNKSIDIQIRGWIGDITARYRLPGKEPSVAEPNDAGSHNVRLTYDPATKTATGELAFPNAPAGRTYWAQPSYSNYLTFYRMPGTKIPMDGPPVEKIPIKLVSNPKQGSRRAVTLSNSSDLTEEMEGEGEDKEDKILIKTTLKVSESVEQPDKTDGAQAARLRLRFESINLSAERFGGVQQQDIINKKNQEELNKFIKVAEAYGALNRFGEMYKYSVGINGVADPLINFLVGAFTNDALESLQATSLPMPNRDVRPGETWEATKDIRLYLYSQSEVTAPDSSGRIRIQQPKPREYKYRDQITYTYLGVRERGGRKEAVIKVVGKSIQAPGVKQTVSGEVSGIAWVEIDTGVVVEATIKKVFELDTSSAGTKKRVTGVNEYKISRGYAQ